MNELTLEVEQWITLIVVFELDVDDDVLTSGQHVTFVHNCHHVNHRIVFTEKNINCTPKTTRAEEYRST